MLLAGFEPAVPSSERPQTHALDRAAAGICPVASSRNVVKKVDKLICFYSYRRLQPVYTCHVSLETDFSRYFRLLVKVRMLDASASDSTYTG
jgi:hypothetical protein